MDHNMLLPLQQQLLAAHQEIDLSTVMPPTRGVLEKYIQENSIVF